MFGVQIVFMQDQESRITKAIPNASCRCSSLLNSVPDCLPLSCLGESDSHEGKNISPAWLSPTPAASPSLVVLCSWHSWICYLIACLFVKWLSPTDVPMWGFGGSICIQTAIASLFCFWSRTHGAPPGHAASSNTDLRMSLLIPMFHSQPFVSIFFSGLRRFSYVLLDFLPLPFYYHYFCCCCFWSFSKNNSTRWESPFSSWCERVTRTQRGSGYSHSGTRQSSVLSLISIRLHLLDTSGTIHASYGGSES